VTLLTLLRSIAGPEATLDVLHPSARLPALMRDAAAHREDGWMPLATVPVTTARVSHISL